jgi:hypothetical protein
MADIKTALNIMLLSKECREALTKGQDKPLYITITYKDGSGRLQHWQGRQRGFPESDILPTLLHLAEDAQKNLIPKGVTGKLRKQLADRKQKL